ncbi:hypothetical protein J3D54_005275 [Pseudomonas sp. GGS8]|nr:hypothetical protein [Pseudomonas sp. GGS8]
MILKSAQGILLLWFMPVVELRHSQMRPPGIYIKDRDSNPTVLYPNSLQTVILRH